MANLRRSIPQLLFANPSLLRSLHFPGYVLPCYSLADPILAGPSFAIAVYSMPINSLANLSFALLWPCLSFRRIALPWLACTDLFRAIPSPSLLRSTHVNAFAQRSSSIQFTSFANQSLALAALVFPDVHRADLALLFFLLDVLPCKCSLA